MTDRHWAIFALRDIQKAIDTDRYDVATFHIEDAIAAIAARDDQDGPSATHEADQRASVKSAG